MASSAIGPGPERSLGSRPGNATCRTPPAWIRAFTLELRTPAKPVQAQSRSGTEIAIAHIPMGQTWNLCRNPSCLQAIDPAARPGPRRLDADRRARGRGIRGARAAIGLMLSLIGLLVQTGSGRAMRDAAIDPALEWRALGQFGVRREPPQALAHSSRSGWIAVGDASGVTWSRGDRTERADLPSVNDLAFDREDVLWIATERGLYRWEPQGRPELRSLRGGERADLVHRVEVVAGSLLLATEAGATWSSDGRLFQPLTVAGPGSPVTRVALRSEALPGLPTPPGGLPRARPVEAWLYGAGRLFVVRGIVRETGLRVLDGRRVELPRPTDERVPMDLTLDPEGRRLYLVYEDLVAWRALEDGPSFSTGSRWQIERPTMPPGARIQRLGWAAGRLWLATDRGLLEAPSLAGPFHRAASPLGTAFCLDLRSFEANGAVALCDSGIFALATSSGPSVARASPFRPAPVPDPLPPDPPVAEIRRRALARAGLHAERGEGLWRGLRNRAFWPELSLGFRVDADRDWTRDADQSFVSGDTRFLLDRGRGRALDLEGTVELEWDLGGIAYPDRSVELSRELRLVVSLRDDVVDEIHQLYFERQSIRERLKTDAETLDSSERARLLIRARELGAGLDAWTGGWLGRWRLDQANAARRSDGPAAPGALARFDAPISNEVPFTPIADEE